MNSARLKRAACVLAYLSASLVLFGCGAGGGIEEIIGGDDPGPAPIKIQMDGDFGDWDRVPVAAGEGTNGTNHPLGMDFTEVKIHHDESFLYFKLVSADRFRFPGDSITGGIIDADPRDTALLSCVIAIDLDDSGSFETSVFGTTVGHDAGGASRILRNAAAMAPMAINGSPSLTEFETMVSRRTLKRLVSGIGTIRVQVISGYGRDEIPNDAFIEYTLD